MEDILRMLEEDGRLTPAQIAERTGRSEQEVAQEIKRLEEQGIIRKYQAVIDWEKAGAEKVYAFIEVKVTPQRGVGFDAVAQRILRFPEVHSLHLISGDHDLHVVLQGNSMKEVAYFVAEKLAPLEGVQSTGTHFVLKTYKMHGHIFPQEEQPGRLPVTL
jgi:DNA-binding Lrp family transcriptional regulator